jgi:hypothetical protein
MKWDPVWRLYRPLGGIFPMTTAESPRHSYRRGVEGIIYAYGTPDQTDYYDTHRSGSHVRAS